MYCYHCNSEAGKHDICPICGADLKYAQKAYRLSMAYYNEGLAKATVRNLSGAVVSLRKSLKFYKYNIDARNLLGLVYYETGEVVDAIGQWVISKSYEKEDNLASRYLDDIQSDSNRLEAINQTIKKYNQALLYCKSDSRDLATIQLKKVLSLNPNFVKAHQLLALLYIQEEKYDQAKKTLRNAMKIDTDNTTTHRYMKEVNAKLREHNPNKKPKNDDLISYTNGNETIIMPKRFKETSVGATVGAIVLGLAVGVAVTSFLFVPNIKSKIKSDASKQLVDANDSLTTKDQTITSLEKQIEELQGQLTAEQGTSEVVNSKISEYDKVLTAYSSYVAGDYVTAGQTLTDVSRDKLSEAGAGIYQTLYDTCVPSYMSALYDNGYNAFYSGDFQGAIDAISKVCALDMGYADGNAVYYLAQAYTNAGDSENAKQYYQYVIDNYPGTQRAITAENYVNGL